MFASKSYQLIRRNALEREQQLEERLNQKVDKAIQLYKETKTENQNLKNEVEGLKKQLQAKVIQKEQNVSVRVASVTNVPRTESEAKLFIYQKESGNRTDAINKSSGACGLGQALPCAKLGCSLEDYACQDAWFTNYAVKRYGGWMGGLPILVSSQMVVR